MLASILVFLSLLFVVEIIASLRIVMPNEVAVRQWFGWLGRKIPKTDTARLNRQWFGWFDRKVLRAGLHFVPRFWGIKLIRISKALRQFPYEGDPKHPSWVISGSQLPVRSKDRQKLGVDGVFFQRFPYEDIDLLCLLIESGVPFENEEKLRLFLEDGFRNDLTAVFGEYNYEQVMGGLLNEELSGKVNKLLQRSTKKEKSMFIKCGFFDADPNTLNKPGTGEAYFRIEYVHVSGPLGERLEQVVTAKLGAEADREAARVRIETTHLEAEAAKNVAQNKQRFIYGPMQIERDEWVKAEAQKMGFPDTPEGIRDATVKLRESGEYERRHQEAVRLREQDMGATRQERKVIVDVNSAGKSIETSGLAAIIGGAIGTAVGAVLAAAKEGDANPSSGGSGNGGGGQKETPQERIERLRKKNQGD